MSTARGIKSFKERFGKSFRRRDFLLLGGGLIFLDQLIKFWAQENLSVRSEGVLKLACNEAISWGIPLQGGWFWFFWVVSMVVLLYLFGSTREKSQWFLVLVLTGAISNILDRILVGCVVDYISLGSFPIFNLADVLISVGAAGFFWSELQAKDKISD
jgi:signal peptidase II